MYYLRRKMIFIFQKKTRLGQKYVLILYFSATNASNGLSDFESN